MNLGPTQVNLTYQYVLNQSGSGITLGSGQAVNWDAAGIVTRTGTQTISGGKTFMTFLGTSSGVTVDLGYFGAINYLGQNAGQNVIGLDAVINYFGPADLLAPNNYFGVGAAINYYGNSANENQFGFYSFLNSIGQSASTNDFGYSAGVNTFGDNANSNSFGCYSEASTPSNRFGCDIYSSDSNFGNFFGENTNFNRFGCFMASSSTIQNLFGVMDDYSNYNQFGGSPYYSQLYRVANNYYGTCSLNNYFAQNSTYNEFGSVSDANYFGLSCGLNVFGSNSSGNYFGTSSINYFGLDGINYFGNPDVGSVTNVFGGSAISNQFGVSSTSNTFGESASLNKFGFGTTGNLYGSGACTGTLRLKLPSFTGASTQAGQFGEARVSGSGLYICTGTTGGWGRVFLATF